MYTNLYVFIYKAREKTKQYSIKIKLFSTTTFFLLIQLNFTGKLFFINALNLTIKQKNELYLQKVYEISQIYISNKTYN